MARTKKDSRSQESMMIVNQKVGVWKRRFEEALKIDREDAVIVVDAELVRMRVESRDIEGFIYP